MDLEQGLKVVVDAGVPLLGDRFYRERLPQETLYPAATYQRNSTQSELMLSGPSTLHDVTLRIDIVARNAASAEAVADEMRPVIHGVTGDFGGVNVQIVHIIDETDVAVFDGDQDYLIISFTVMASLHE
jgi:hypothetical protein